MGPEGVASASPRGDAGRVTDVPREVSIAQLVADVRATIAKSPYKRDVTLGELGRCGYPSRLHGEKLGDGVRIHGDLGSGYGIKVQAIDLVSAPQIRRALLDPDELRQADIASRLTEPRILFRLELHGSAFAETSQALWRRKIRKKPQKPRVYARAEISLGDSDIAQLDAGQRIPRTIFGGQYYGGRGQVDNIHAKMKRLAAEYPLAGIFASLYPDTIPTARLLKKDHLQTLRDAFVTARTPQDRRL